MIILRLGTRMPLHELPLNRVWDRFRYRGGKTVGRTDMSFFAFAQRRKSETRRRRNGKGGESSGNGRLTTELVNEPKPGGRNLVCTKKNKNAETWGRRGPYFFGGAEFSSSLSVSSTFSPERAGRRALSGTFSTFATNDDLFDTKA